MVHPPPRSVSGGPEITSACAELATAAATMVRRCLILMRNPPITWAGKETASPKAISLAQRPRTEPIEPSAQRYRAIAWSLGKYRAGANLVVPGGGAPACTSATQA